MKYAKELERAKNPRVMRKGATQAFTGFWFPHKAFMRVRASRKAFAGWVTACRGINSFVKKFFIRSF